MFLNDIQLSSVTSHKHLGVTLTSSFSFSNHVSEICDKASKRANILKFLSWRMPRNALEITYKSTIRPILEYASPIWCSLSDIDCTKLENVQLSAARACSGAMRGTSHSMILNELGWEKLSVRRDTANLAIFFKMHMSQAPVYLNNLLPTRARTNVRINLRRAINQVNYTTPLSRNGYRYKSFLPSTVRLWNSLPLNFSLFSSVLAFKRKLSVHYHVPRKIKCYQYGYASLRIHHARIRMGFSQLNLDLFHHGCTASPACACLHLNESAQHFLLECLLLFDLTYRMLTALNHSFNNEVLSVDVGLMDNNTLCKRLVCGSPDLSDAENLVIFDTVFQFIKDSRRFERFR